MLSEEMKISFQLRLSAITDLSRDIFFVLLMHCRCYAQAEERMENANNFPHRYYPFFPHIVKADIAFLMRTFPMEKYKMF